MKLGEEEKEGINEAVPYRATRREASSNGAGYESRADRERLDRGVWAGPDQRGHPRYWGGARTPGQGDEWGHRPRPRGLGKRGTLPRRDQHGGSV